MPFYIFLSLFSLLFSATTLDAKVVYATFVAPVDGDTLVFEKKKERFYCQLDGVDAPEMSASAKMAEDSTRCLASYQQLKQMGEDAATYVQTSFLHGEKYKIDMIDTKRANVKRCIVYLKSGRLPLNEKMLAEGYAVVDRKGVITSNPGHLKRYKQFEVMAKYDQMGLWRDEARVMECLREQ